MTREEIAYALAKKVNTVREVITKHGAINMDAELAKAVGDALRTALTARLERLGVEPPSCRRCKGHGCEWCRGSGYATGE